MATHQNATQQQRMPNGEVEQRNNDMMQFGQNPRFGTVRDRLFQTMLIRLSLPYYQTVPSLVRQLFEFLTLLNAFGLLSVLIYTHFLLNAFPGRCLETIHDDWPKKGIVRLEVIHNLAEFRARWALKENETSRHLCHFDLADVLRSGLLPVELRSQQQKLPDNTTTTTNQWLAPPQQRPKAERPLPIWFDVMRWMADQFYEAWDWERDEDEEEQAEAEKDTGDGIVDTILHLKREGEVTGAHADVEIVPFYYHLVEFSLHYGLLKLNMEMRHELGVEVKQIQLDPEHEGCFKDWRERFFMRYLIGMDELVLSSVKQMLENETDRGYLRDLIGGELYHFVTVAPSSSSTYLTALIVMLIFTFAISMLLRFSHDQIFVFIVDLFQMFEQNQPLIFPIAPLLTVILALVGMEAIMSEIFNDTTTAFYVILLVWLADQYDAIFCHSPVGRRHWLRFFNLYHFAFYAYHYRYNGLYGGLALLTSAAFTLHSMVFFYHHYELPFIIHQEQIANQRQQGNLNENGDGAAEVDGLRRFRRNEFGAVHQHQINHATFTLLLIELRRSMVETLSTMLEIMLDTMIARRLIRSAREIIMEEERVPPNARESRESAGQTVPDRVAEQIVGQTMREFGLETEEAEDRGEEDQTPDLEGIHR